jgi:hypothetical protein
LGAHHRTGPLRPDLHDAIRLLRCRYHRQSIRRIVRHRLLAVHIFARRQRIHYYLLMPVVRNGNDDRVDILGVEEFLVAPGRPNRLAHDLLRQLMAPVVKIGGRHTLHPAQLNRVREKTRAFHADAHNPEANSVIRTHRLIICIRSFRLQEGSTSHQRSAGGSRCRLQKPAT